MDDQVYVCLTNNMREMKQHHQHQIYPFEEFQIIVEKYLEIKQRLRDLSLKLNIKSKNKDYKKLELRLEKTQWNACYLQEMNQSRYLQSININLLYKIIMIYITSWNELNQDQFQDLCQAIQQHSYTLLHLQLVLSFTNLTSLHPLIQLIPLFNHLQSLIIKATFISLNSIKGLAISIYKLSKLKELVLDFQGNELDSIEDFIHYVPKMNNLSVFKFYLNNNPDEKLGFQSKNFEELQEFLIFCDEYYK